MARYFGTDGVRARINTGPMTAENIVRLALAAGRYFTEVKPQAPLNRRPRPLVIIGKDTRLSGYMVEAALQAGFASIGMDTRLLGPLPTPGVAYLTRTLRADMGVMISASHNPHHDNGIKLFGPDGYKLPDADEDAIADIMSAHIPLVEAKDLGRAKRMQDGLGRYVEAVKVALPRTMRFSGLKVVVDCAHGAAYRAAPDVLFELGAEVVPLAIAP
ncbi:MAG: phosphoglucosamine mutase, partial [Proteobacteria bacterium]|nr:phosphoglucosamine mutase [Pseudomonadota bacterium]